MFVQVNDKVVKPAHQLCQDAPSQPKYIYVNRSTGLPQAWSGSETWVEFEVPQEIGVWTNTTIEFNVTNTTDLPLPPTPFWISRHELYLGSDLLETVYAAEHYHEVVGFRRTQDLDQVNEAINIDTDYSYRSSTPSGRYYLPLDASLLKPMQPYVKGFDAKFKVRIYFPSSIVVGTPESGSCTLGEVRLIVEESTADPIVKGKIPKSLLAAHKNGVVDYSIMTRQRQVEAISFANASDQKTIYLRSLKDDSAGLLVYITPQQPTNAQLSTRYALSTLQVQDQMGGKITEVLDASFLKPFVWPTHIDSPFPNTDGNELYLIPFSSSFQETVSTACNHGDRPFTTLERLIVSPGASTTGNCMITVVSLAHGFLTCANGKHYLTPKSRSA